MVRREGEEGRVSKENSKSRCSACLADVTRGGASVWGQCNEQGSFSAEHVFILLVLLNVIHVWPDPEGRSRGSYGDFLASKAHHCLST